MHFHIYCNQKSISDTHLMAMQEFQKRLSPYCETSLLTAKTPLVPHGINTDNCYFLVHKSGKSSYSSEIFAKKINDLLLSGKSHIFVYIGFSDSLIYEHLSSFMVADRLQNFSLTICDLCPETMALLFYEQLYRGFTILQGKTYHK